VQKEVAWLREATVRQYLYDRMREPGDKERLDHRLDRVVLSPATHSAYGEAEFAAYFTELDGAERQQEVRRLVDEKNQELITLLKHLGDLLAETPIRTGTTEYEPLYDRPRPFDVIGGDDGPALRAGVRLSLLGSGLHPRLQGHHLLLPATILDRHRCSFPPAGQ
jgi:hypothetical protein